MPGVRPSCAMLLYGLLTVLGVSQAFRTVCYYDGKALWRKDVVKVGADELKPILKNCTHLVYGYAGIDHEKFTAKSLDPKLDLPESKDVKGGKGNFKSITSLKKEFPHLIILLSVGGDADYEKPEKYLETLNKPYSRTEFASSISEMAKAHGFDGIDLAWQFPVVTEKKEKYSWSSIIHKIAKTIGISDSKDPKEAEHKDQFTALVREVKGVLNANNCSYLSVSILPHVNSTAYFDFPGLQKYVDHYTLMVYDFRNPFRVPKLADYTSPSRFVYGYRVPEQNIEWRVYTALLQGMEPKKMVMGIATFGRTWKLDNEVTDKSGTPPLKADGPADGGTYTETEGLLAYYEICPHLVESAQAVTSLTMLSRKPDTSGNILGTYAFRLPNGNAKGIWISFEEPETAIEKATFVHTNNYGGLAFLDVSMDDARGLCGGNKYPIFKAVKTVF